MDRLYRIRAFTEDSMGGNLAGVMVDADILNEGEMQRIARDVGYSETAFVLESKFADYRLRFYTPTEEVDLCGHATIATFNLLRELEKVEIGEYTQETKAGILRLRVCGEEVYMEQNRPVYGEVIHPQEISNCFNALPENYLVDDLPVQVVSTGMRDIILPISGIDALHKLEPNREAIIRISKKYRISGIHAFAMESMNRGVANGRNFAPVCGIDEESATGTSNGALACYLSKYKDDYKTHNYILEQGHSMNQPSEIKVRLGIEGSTIKEVWVGGKASIHKV